MLFHTHVPTELGDTNFQNPSNSEMDNPTSTLEEYEQLPLGSRRPVFRAFGNVSWESILGFCKKLSLEPDEIIAVEDVWIRHPFRQQRQG
jgi:hypothetical protein